MQRRETVDLLECRNKLDVIDKQIVKLFEERMDICGKVAEALELAKAQRLTPLESSSRGITSYSSASK